MSSCTLLVSQLDQSVEGSTFQGEGVPVAVEVSLANLQSPNPQVMESLSQDAEMECEGSSAVVQTVPLALSDLPLSVTDPQSKILAHVVSHDSGAIVVQPALTVVSTVEELPGLGDGPGGQYGPSTAFQLVPEGSIGAMDPTGLLPCERAEFSPSQEQSKNLEIVPDLKNLKTLAVCLQNTVFNNSESKTDIHKPFSLKSVVLCNATDTQSIINSKPEEKVLYFNNMNEQVLSTSQNSNICKETTQMSVGTSSIITDYNTALNMPIKQPSKFETPKRGISYSKALAPPNVYPSNTGYTPECGVVLQRLQGFSLDAYAWAVVKVIGESSITFIGREPSNDDMILIFVKTPKMAEMLVNEGVWLKGKWLNISYFQQPATKLTVSGVLPFIPDSLIIDAFSPFGTSVYPILRKIPAAVRHQQFKGAFSFRREIYIIKSSHDIIIPKTLNISFLGMSYQLDISSTGTKCFLCGSLLHTINKCDQLNHNVNSILQPSFSVPLANTSLETSSSKIPPLKNYSADFVEKSNTISPNTSVLVSKEENNFNKSEGCKFTLNTATSDHFTQCNMTNSLPISKLNIEPLYSITVNSKKKKKNGKTKLPVSAKIIDGISNQQSCSSIGEVNKNSNSNTSIISTALGNKVQPMSCSTLMSPTSELSFQQDSNKLSFPDKKKLRKTTNLPILDAIGGFQVPSVKQKQGENEVSEEQYHKELGEDQMSVDEGQSLGLNPCSTVNELSKNKTKKDHNRTATSELGQKDTFSIAIENLPAKPPKIDIKFAVALAEDWIKKSASLKVNIKKKLAVQMLEQYPNLDELMSVVIQTSGFSSSSSAKGRRIRDLIEDITYIRLGPRSSRVRKRKQILLSPP